MFKTYHKQIISSLALLALLLLGRMFIHAGKTYHDDHLMSDFKDNYKVYTVSIPNQMSFAGEEVPLYRFDIRENLEKELLTHTYNQSNSIIMHKRAYRWFKTIEPILKQQNIPDDFKYLALAESGFTMEVSRHGASGFWQFISTTATAYGLEVNDEIDERFDPVKSTYAACKYFRDAYRLLGSWTLVAASYNMGVSGIQKEMQRQKNNNYYDLLLKEETEHYLYRVLTLKEIIEHPLKYGYRMKKTDRYPMLKTHKFKMDTTINNLIDWAVLAGSNFKMLRIFNPWILGQEIHNPGRKTYLIELPLKGADEQLAHEIHHAGKWEIENKSETKPAAQYD